MGEHFLLKLKHQGHIKLLIILSLMTAAIFTLSIQIISNRSIDKLSDTNDLLVNRFKSITLLEETNGNLRTIESDARGYLITGDPDFKEEMQKAKENLAEIALILEANANLGETNGNTMAELAVLIAEKISWNDQLIQLIDNGSSAEAEIMLKAGSSKLLMNDIGNLITELRLQEEIYVADKTSSAQNLAWRSTTGTLLGTVLSFIVTLMAAWLIFSELRRQNILHQQLEENEKRLIQFLESMPVGVAVVSKKHELHFLNSEGRKILGIKDLNYQNTILKFEDIVATATNAKVNLDTKIKDVFLGKSLTNTSIKYTTQSGERQLHSTWRPMISEVGEIEYAIVTFYDVTARKKAKTELIKARKLAEDSVKAKESFLANMSHEIRTPMNAIVGFTEILMQEGVSASQKRKLDLIKVSGDNLLTIINDILDFSKIEAGMMHLEKIAISLPETIQSVYNTMLMKADDKGINFSLKNVEDLPKAVLGDSVRLSQILINLLNNAIKFTNEGTVELNCASQPLSDSKTLVTLTIKDSGLGMSADQIRRIFDRFSQAQADTTRKYGGTGLGLNIVKKLVDLHNGSLEVVSTPGKGSEFIINLPFVLTDDYAVLQTNVDKGSQSLVLDPTLRILVVEDNPINQELAKTVLEGFGSQVEVADNGVKCIELLQKHKYDLILMDIQMPEMDGYETTKTIREVFSLEVPIIAMTANVLSSEIDKCIISGMNDYLSKPFKTIDLYNIIKKHSPESKKNYSIPDSKSSHQKNTSEEVLNSGSTIDLTYIKEMSNGRPEFAKDMIKLFLNNVPSQLDLMKKAIQNRDYLQIKNLAHSLKSNMNYYGLHTARSWLIDIEQLAVEEGSILLIKKTYKLIASNIQEASRCLQQELDILDEVIV